MSANNTMPNTNAMALDSDDESMSDFTPPISATASQANVAEGSGELDSAAAAKRRAIQAIMRDPRLSELERRHKIQGLHDGSSQLVPDLAAGGPTDAAICFATTVLPDKVISCVHYERKCNVVAPCCGRLFGCRICHDELTPPPGHGPMDRFSVKEVVCKECHCRQKASNLCVRCGVTFGEYHCPICNLWMAESKKPFHCADCGFCRVGGRNIFRHCHKCCMCISINVYNDHNCMKDKYKNNCPVCREDMFSSRQPPQDLPCGHAIHAHCFRKLAGFDYRCPICKKTVVSQQSMAAAWAARARDIEMQPMPSDLARVVNIMCNDCETKSVNRNWHFLGVQCLNCNSFNTVVGQVISSGSAESDQNLTVAPGS